MAQAVPNLCVNRKVFLKYQVNWNTVSGALQDLPWRNICGLLTILLRFWMKTSTRLRFNHLSLLVERYVPIKFIRVRNKDKPWSDDQCRRAFDLKQEAYLRWTRE